MLISWLFLAGAICFEVVGTMALKYASINQTPIYAVITAVGYIVSFVFLYFAIKKIEMGTAYAIWAGLGTAIIAVSGVIIFKEDMSILKALFLMLIIIGAVGLKYLSGSQG